MYTFKIASLHWLHSLWQSTGVPFFDTSLLDWVPHGVCNRWKGIAFQFHCFVYTVAKEHVAVFLNDLCRERATFWVVAPHYNTYTWVSWPIYFVFPCFVSKYFVVGTDWKMGVAVADSIGDRLHNVMHSVGTDLAMGWITVCYTSTVCWSLFHTYWWILYNNNNNNKFIYILGIKNWQRSF